MSPRITRIASIVKIRENTRDPWRQNKNKMNIAVAGTGYVGLSIATLLAQHNHVTAVDVIPEKVDLINHKKSPIQDEYIEKYLAEKDLDLTATLDGPLSAVRVLPQVSWPLSSSS